MIEVEKNFDLRPGDKERLIQGAHLIAEKRFTDVYYDTSDYKLTGNDYWLRQRDGRWELKVPLSTKGIHERSTDQYRELETETEIAHELSLQIKKNLAEALETSGFEAFASIVTTRESFQKGDFHLDFDEMDFGFTTFEVELMVATLDEVNSAEKRIIDFSTEHSIASTVGHGKVIEYILRHNPAHYALLIAKGIVREQGSESN